jgi:hypothetical protein
MCFEFLRVFNPLVVQAVLLVSLNSYHNRFVHLVADDFADLHFAIVALAHGHPPFPGY